MSLLVELHQLPEYGLVELVEHLPLGDCDVSTRLFLHGEEQEAIVVVAGQRQVKYGNRIYSEVFSYINVHDIVYLPSRGSFSLHLLDRNGFLER